MNKKRKEKMNMELAKKIFDERKRLGLSQEQFAEQMGVSRQAVSKWESGQSMPDLDKLVLMSQVFGVSTDYLLKEQDTFSAQNRERIVHSQPLKEEEDISKDMSSQKEDGSPEGYLEGGEEGSIRKIEVKEVRKYQETCFRAAARIALGVFLCIFGVVLYNAVSMYLEPKNVSLELAVVPMLIFIAAAVGLFISCGMSLEKYKYFKTEPFLLPEREKLRVTEEYDAFYNTFVGKITAGIILCIVAVIGYIICEAVGENADNSRWDYISTIVLLLLVAVAVYIFVRTGIKKDCYTVLLQQEGFAADQKKKRAKSAELTEKVAGIYWCTVAAGFLAYNFITADWGRSWIVWPVAGCLFGAVSIAIEGVNAK